MNAGKKDAEDLERITDAIQALRRPLTRLLLARVERRRSGDFDAVCLSPAQHLTLLALAAQPLSMSALADRTGVAISTATRMVQSLHRSGLVSPVVMDGGDRRRRYVALTTSGRRAAEAESQAQTERVRRLLGELSSTQRAAVLAGVEALVVALAADEQANSQTGASA